MTVAKALVIVESPAKAKTINKYLGKQYTVMASLGHVKDLPKKDLAVDVDNDFEPRYEVIEGKKKLIQELKAASKKVDSIYLAADPDREGEAICYHLQEELDGKKKGSPQVFRVMFNEITANAIRKARRQTMVCFEVRYSAQFMLAKSVVDQGLLGDLHYAEVDYYHGLGPWYGQFPWNVKKDMGGSSLLTAGCHALDGLLFFMGGQVEEVTAYETRSKNPTFAPFEYATTTTTLLKFTDGRVGKVASVVDCLQPYYFHVHLVGSEGSLLDNRFTSTRLPGLKKDRWSTLETSLVDSGDVKDHPYVPQFQAFVDAVQAGRPMPRTDFETAYESHRVVFAADRSAREGRPVKLVELP